MSNNTNPTVAVHPQLELSFLGPEDLANLWEVSIDGIVVADEQRRYVYANPAACRILGYSEDDLLGRDFLSNFPESAHSELLARFEESLQGKTGVWQSTIMRPDGSKRDIEYSNTTMMAGGRQCGVAIFRDVTETHRLQREGAAFSRIASSVAFGGSLENTLDSLCRHVVDATDTVAASVSLSRGEAGGVQVVGCYGHSGAYIEALNRFFGTGVETPTGQAFAERRTSMIRDARRVLLADPRCTLIHPFMADVAWDTIVAVPMLYGNDAVGVLTGYYPTGDEPCDEDIAFLEAIASQAAVAVENARLLTEVQDRAAVEERARLARELHDSVTQALFSINLTARSAEVALERDDKLQLVKKKLADLRQLTQGALAEMRALIFELRPGALEEEGLVQALKKHAAAVQGRDLLQIEVRVEGSEFPRLRPDLEESLYRAAQEALHNVVKHAKATQSRVILGLEQDAVFLRIEDNGLGFHPEDVPAGHMGLQNIRQRAEAFGGECHIASASGQGTAITLRVPFLDK